MKKFSKITIIGVGLIGGSIGLAVKKRRLAKVVCGVGR
ncbi:MAG: prephenate dehydrogenase/arogenate dehydrogenase family protein, partial [Candidatus Omnitrophica bacterium CG10_big_fil_rev_8_21_14_0_10_43_8]